MTTISAITTKKESTNQGQPTSSPQTQKSVLEPVTVSRQVFSDFASI